jgi:RNA polymerase sigma-70 factor (sigma-E family)
MRSKLKKQRGDEEFVEFASARGAHLLRTAYLLTGDWHLAEDLVQETLGKMFVAWRGAAAIDNPAAYVQTVLVRTHLSHRRRRSASELPHADVPESAARESDVALRMSLMDGLARLETKDRAVIVLRYWEDRSVEETAGALGMSAAAVRNQSSRALARLRGVLGPRFAELADGDADPDADPDADSDAAPKTSGSAGSLTLAHEGAPNAS